MLTFSMVQIISQETHLITFLLKSCLFGATNIVKKVKKVSIFIEVFGNNVLIIILLWML